MARCHFLRCRLLVPAGSWAVKPLRIWAVAHQPFSDACARSPSASSCLAWARKSSLACRCCWIAGGLGRLANMNQPPESCPLPVRGSPWLDYGTAWQAVIRIVWLGRGRHRLCGRAGQRLAFASIVGEGHPHQDVQTAVGRHQGVGRSRLAGDVDIRTTVSHNPLVAVGYVGQTVGVGNCGRGLEIRVAYQLVGRYCFGPVPPWGCCCQTARVVLTSP